MTVNPTTAADLAPSREPRAFLATGVSTLLTLPLTAVALLCVGVTHVDCAGCKGAVLDRFDTSYGIAFTVFALGVLVILGMLVAAWTLAWQRRNTAARLWLAVIAPPAVVFDFIVFYWIVDWP
ncbi:hypothetical protein ACGFYQ_22600 [Streptomyces sp. NPDC048258]|uniref:hypothetical protein n=1 Tax=Streptomyces sp. NPDC048258 TaxID=3365527 RepID=UPI00371F45B0